MNIILFDRAEKQDGNIVLRGERAEHLVKVLQSQEGDWVRIGEIGGLLGRGQVVSLQRKFPFVAELRIELAQSPPPLPRLDLILALPRPVMLKRILSQITALGVGRLFIIHSRRVEKSFWDSTLLQQEDYVSHLRRGLEQAAVDTRLPEISFHRKFKPFLEDVFPQQREDYQHCLLAHPAGTGSLAEILPGSSGRIVFAVGPEGGWIEYEVAKFAEQGFVSCGIGTRILKVDTAVVALHAQISALASWPDQR